MGNENKKEINKEMNVSENNENWLYLPASILLASIIVSASVFIVGGNIASGLSGLQVNDSNPVNSKPVKIEDFLSNAAGSIGSDDAEVFLIEYSDFQCPFCRSWFVNSKSNLIKDYVSTGKVKFLYKDFPLSAHPMAQTYAEAARCAGDQGKFWEMHDMIYEEQQKLGNGIITSLTKDDVKDWAKELGLNTSEFNSCLDSGKYSEDIKANLEEAVSVGIGGTPSFLIGKKGSTPKLIVGAQPYSVFKNAIEDLLK